jgi:hypothetical protein
MAVPKSERDQAALQPAYDPGDQDVPEVDLDLDMMDEQLRKERVGKPVTVRLDGTVIHITNAADWSSSAMELASTGSWTGWAREVIEDDDEYKAWVGADLKNYQVEAVFDECGRSSRLDAGKSRKQSGSRRGSQRR